MIKKFNKLMDDMPLFLKIIIGVIMAGFLALMPFFYKVVSAAPTTYPLDAWSVGHAGQDSGAKANGASFSWAWTRDNYSTAYINIVYTARTGTTTAHARVETNFANFCLFSAYVFEGNTKTNITVTRQCSGNNNNNVDYYFQMVSTQGQNITLQLKPIAPLTLLSNMSITATISGSQDVEISNDLTNDTFINATNNQTTTIINNINENVNDLKEGFINALNDSNIHCENRKYNVKENIEIKGKYLQSDGTLQNDSNYGISKYIPINANKTYNVIRNYTANRYYCLYDKNQTLINCSNMGSNTSFNITLNQEGFIRLVNYQEREMSLNGEYCQTNTEATINAIDDLSFMQRQRWTEEDEQEAERNNLIGTIINSIGNLFNFLGDDDVDNPDETLTDLSENLGTNSVISDLLLLPVSVFQKVLTGINGTCQSFSLGSLYNHQLSMTCINLQNILGSTLYGVIDILISGLFVLVIRKKFVDIFLHLTSLKTGGNELE